MYIPLDENMVQIFLNESISAARNRMHAQKASGEGKEALAKLLNAMAAAEEIRAERILMKLRGKIDDPDAHRETLTGFKKDEYESEYPRMKKEYTDDRPVEKLLGKYEKAAENHYQVLADLQEGKLAETGTYHVCEVCGYIAADEAPERCPACNAIREKFREVA